MKLTKILTIAVLAILLTGCGRKWEQLWGQDTRPETRYIPLTPDQFEMTIGPMEPFQWGDGRFKKARYLNVWACRSDNVCVALPHAADDEMSMVFYVLDYNLSIITITGLKTIRIGGVQPSKVRFQLVM